MIIPKVAESVLEIMKHEENIGKVEGGGDEVDCNTIPNLLSDNLNY